MLAQCTYDIGSPTILAYLGRFAVGLNRAAPRSLCLVLLCQSV